MKIHQNFVALAIAAGFALLVLLANIVLLAPESLLRMGFAAALYLVSRDTLAGASIAKGARKLGNPDRWVYAINLTLFFGTFMLLALWRGRAALPELLVPVAAGAGLFGLLLAFAFESPPYPYAHHFQTGETAALGPVRKFLYYAVTLLKPLIIWLLLHQSQLNTAHLLSYTILLGFAGPRYRRKSDGNVLWAYFPLIVGLVVLVALLFAPF